MAADAPASTPPPGHSGNGRSLRSTLIRRLALASLVPVALLGAGELATGYRRERQTLSDQLGASSVLSALAVDEFLQAHLSAVSLVASTPRRPGDDWAPDLRRLRAQYPALTSALVTDAQGNVLLSDPPANHANRHVRDREYYSVPARTGQRYLSNAFTGRVLGTDPLIAVSAPLFVGGRFDGVVEGSIQVHAFTRLRSSALRQRGFEMMILDRERHVVHASAGLPFAFDQNLARAAFLQRPQRRAGASLTQARDVLAGGGDAFVAQSDTSRGWTVLLFAPESALGTSLMRRLATFLGILVLVALATWAVVQLQMRRFAVLMDNLLGALQELATQRSVTSLQLGNMPEEVRPLAQSIDDLAKRLDSAHYENLELDRLNRTDVLTGVLNRRGFDEHLAHLVDVQRRTIAIPVAALAFDIDHFKAYNDRYGHLAGDNALRRVAGAITGCLRDKDDILARMGGEEFMALLVEADVHTACEVAERARRAVSGLGIPHADAPSGALTVSVGVYVAAVGAHPLVLAQLADQALYRAKRDGRDRVAL